MNFKYKKKKPHIKLSAQVSNCIKPALLCRVGDDKILCKQQGAGREKLGKGIRTERVRLQC